MTSPLPRPGHPVRGSATGRPIMALFDLLGRTWAMGILWQLSTGPASFRTLQGRCDQISSSLLAKRLKELRGTHLVTLTDAGYDLTPLGRELAQHLRAMGSWAESWAEAFEAPTPPPG